MKANWRDELFVEGDLIEKNDGRKAMWEFVFKKTESLLKQQRDESFENGYSSACDWHCALIEDKRDELVEKVEGMKKEDTARALRAGTYVSGDDNYNLALDQVIALIKDQDE